MANEAPLKRRRRTSFDWSTAFIAVAVVISAVVVYRRDGQGRFFEILFSDIALFIDIGIASEMPGITPATPSGSQIK